MPRFRLIISTMRPELVTALKAGLQSKPQIEMIITVSRPSEAENKLSRLSYNVLLTDLDCATPDFDRIKSYAGRYQFLALYTSAAISRGKFESRSGDDFLLKPPVFTQAASVSYADTLYKRMEGFVRQQTLPVTRELGKLVAAASDAKIVAVAASTGGTTAFESILKQLPSDAPPMVVVQHMPSGFTKLYAERLNTVYKQEIKEAVTGDYLMRGRILLAPAERHMKIIRQQGRYAVECFIGTKLHGVMPAADVLFDAVADVCKANAVGVVLTGMGSDGARGLLKMHNAGAKNIGQNEQTSVVYGMPKVAKGLGAIDYELPLEMIAEKIVSLSG
jgi:two-component system chemotaxis response regulator CheB